MKDGAIFSNSGHFNVELDLPALARISTAPPDPGVGPGIQTEKRQDRVPVLGEGRLVNLAAAEGHPSVVMDMSFANQALASEYLTRKTTTSWKRKSIPCRKIIDQEIARLKLAAMGWKSTP
jgi:adenosylhomocysteinase